MRSENYRLISEDILAEIERKKSLLEGNPCYHLNINSGKKKALQKEAARHSVSLELEGYDVGTTTGKVLKNREEKRSGKNLLDALEWGIVSYDGAIDEFFVREIGKRVDPISNEYGFRKGNVKILNAQVSPPRYEKVHRELASFFLENSHLRNPMGRAVHAHFNLARIHPFEDGNGRTSRLVQNIVLEREGYFPIMISMNERDEYMDLIDRAVTSYKNAEGDLADHRTYFEAKQSLIENVSLREKKFAEAHVLEVSRTLLTSEQSEFYNYLALKIRDVLQRESKKLYNSCNAKSSRKKH
jgi:Fic family protein